MPVDTPYAAGPLGRGPQSRPVPGQPVRVLARLVQAALVLAIAAELLLVWAVVQQRSAVHSALDGGATAVADIEFADRRANAYSNRAFAVLVVVAVVFVVWFWRVRQSAGGFDPAGQRRSQGWALWGWLCPIVSFWFPLQIAMDAVRSTPGESRRAERIVGAWWAFFVVGVVLNRVSAAQDPQTLLAFQSQTALEIVTDLVIVIAGALAIVTVAVITRRLERYRASLLLRPLIRS